MRLQHDGCLLQLRRDEFSLLRRQIAALRQPEPTCPGRRQLGQQAGRQLFDRVGRRAVEQLVGAFGAWTFDGRGGLALGHRIGVAFAPVGFPIGATRLGVGISAHDFLGIQIGHGHSPNKFLRVRPTSLAALSIPRSDVTMVPARPLRRRSIISRRRLRSSSSGSGAGAGGGGAGGSLGELNIPPMADLLCCWILGTGAPAVPGTKKRRPLRGRRDADTRVPFAKNMHTTNFSKCQVFFHIFCKFSYSVPSDGEIIATASRHTPHGFQATASRPRRRYKAELAPIVAVPPRSGGRRPSPRRHRAIAKGSPCRPRRSVATGFGAMPDRKAAIDRYTPRWRNNAGIRAGANVTT